MSAALPSPADCCPSPPCPSSACGPPINFDALVEQSINSKLCLYSVKDAGAVGDGIADDTDAIQTTLDLQGITVLPCGHYRITHQLSLPANAVLVGCLPSGRSYFSNPAAFDGGSWIDIDVTPGASIDPSILIAGDNVRVENVAFYYPHQLSESALAGAIIVFPPTIGSNHQIVSAPIIRNCYWWNAYIALDLYGAQRPLLHDLGIGAVYQGLTLDRCLDYPHLSNIQVYPFFQPNGTPKALRAFMEANCEAYRLGNVDGMQADHLTTYGVKVGLHCFIGFGGGNCMGQVHHITFDATDHPILIDEASSYILSIDHGLFICGNTQSNQFIDEAITINSPSGVAVVRLSNFRLIPFTNKFVKVGMNISGGFIFVDGHYSWACGYGGPTLGAVIKISGGLVSVSDTVLRRLGGVPDVTQLVSAFDVSGGVVYINNCITFFCAYDLNLSGGTVYIYDNQFQSGNVSINKTGGTLYQGVNALATPPSYAASDFDPTLPSVVSPFITPDLKGFVEIRGKGQTVAALDTTGNLGGLVVRSMDVSVGSGGAIMFGADGQLWAAIKALGVDLTNNSEGDLAVCLRSAKTDATLTEIARFIRKNTIVFPALPVYVDNAAAAAALPPGALYHKTGDLDTVSIVH